MYDLIIKGGHVIDPANHIDARLDIAVQGDRIAAVDKDIPTDQSKKIAHVNGYYVTPGLIDIHLHAYGGYNGWMFPDEHVLPQGVTTVVDTGGAGCKKFEHFKDTIISESKTRVLALINIVGAGMEGAVEQDTSEMDPIPCAEIISKYPEHIIGSKTAHFGGPGWEAVDGAIEAARRSGTMAMMDFAPKPTRSYRELLLNKMSPGDIHTHMYAQHIPLLDNQKKINDYVIEARDKGIIFDLGHGGGSFWFRIAIPAIEQGFVPDTISTDLHKFSALIPNANMTTTMSKCLNMGMSMPDVIMRSTSNPARIIRRPELGTLRVGAEADIAVLDLKKGDYGFVDSGRARLTGDQRLQCLFTVRAGQVAWDLNGLTRPEWNTQGEYTRAE